MRLSRSESSIERDLLLLTISSNVAILVFPKKEDTVKKIASCTMACRYTVLCTQWRGRSRLSASNDFYLYPSAH